MILAEQDEEQDGRRHFQPETMAPIDATTNEEAGPPVLMTS